MSTEHTPPIVSLIDGDGPGPRDALVVEEVLLPMLLIPAVPVVLRDVREPISILQRFLLQAAVDVGVLDLREAQQATAVPLFALRRIAWEFACSGLFTADDQPGRFTPNDELCRRSLAMDRVELEKPGVLHFLFLPETDELIALDMDAAAKKFVAELQTSTPDAGFPTPHLEGIACEQFLVGRLADGAIGGLPSDFLRFGTTPPTPAEGAETIVCPLPSSAPAFRVRFTALSEKQEFRCPLRLLVNRRSPEVDVSSARVLVSTTMEHTAAARVTSDGIPSLRAEGVPAGANAMLNFESPVRARMLLEGWVAAQVASRGWLTRSYTLRVQHPSRALTTRATLTFAAGDETAERLFAVDSAAQEVLHISAPTPRHLAMAVDRAGRGCESKQVVDRLWESAEFACIHAIRVQEDLFHD